MSGEVLVKRRAQRISNSSATALAIAAAIATTGASAQGVEGTFGLAAMVHTPDWPNMPRSLLGTANRTENSLIGRFPARATLP